MLVAPTSVSFHSPKWVFSPKYHFTLLPYSKEVLSVAFCCVCVGRVSRPRGEYYEELIVRASPFHSHLFSSLSTLCLPWRLERGDTLAGDSGGQVRVPITEVLTLAQRGKGAPGAKLGLLKLRAHP